LLALESESDKTIDAPFPLDALVAETQGMIGYWLSQALRNRLSDRACAALVTQTVVDADDPGFRSPTKFIGRDYDEATAKQLAAQRGWSVKQDGPRWRRVVASPEPREIVELATIKALVATNTIVVCAGGGGVPVLRDGNGSLGGVAAVIDKDLTTALLANQLSADLLVFLTDVEGVYRDFGLPHQRLIARATPSELRDLSLPLGSMGPKVEAACRFVEATGCRAAIGALDQVDALVQGARGTSLIAS